MIFLTPICSMFLSWMIMVLHFIFTKDWAAVKQSADAVVS